VLWDFGMDANSCVVVVGGDAVVVIMVVGTAICVFECFRKEEGLMRWLIGLPTVAKPLTEVVVIIIMMAITDFVVVMTTVRSCFV